jgi:hypothetical protein
VALRSVTGVRWEALRTLTVGTLGPRTADKEVVRFDVAVNEVLFMDRLNTSDL